MRIRILRQPGHLSLAVLLLFSFSARASYSSRGAQANPVVSLRQIPIWWSPQLHLGSLQAIPEKLQEPVELPSNEPGIELRNGEDQKLRVFTCAEYLEAIGKDFYPATQYDADMESLFVHRCYVLRDLQNARPARRSHVRHDAWSANAASEIPPLFSSLSDEGTALKILEEAKAKGKSWRSFQPNLRITLSRNNPLILHADDDSSSYALEILASGDFDGDGWEDLAVSGGVHAKGGTYFRSYYFILSRRRNELCMHMLTESTAPFHIKTTAGTLKSDAPKFQ